MNRLTVDIEALADHVLALIRRKPGQPVEIDRISRLCNTGPDEAVKAIEFLASCDYRLRRRKASVTFVRAPDLLTATEIGYRLKTKTMGRSIAAYQSVKSTNDIAARMADVGAAEGTLITAEQQTRGRGRMGRSWYSPSQTGIYLSVILRPPFSAEQAPGLSIMTALALADTLETYCPGDIHIKWPNDLLIGEKKVAGILTELSADKQKVNHVIVGVGINVNQGAGTFPPEIRPIATSVRRAIKRKVHRVKLLQEFLVQFEKGYLRYLQQGLKRSRPRLRRYSSLLGNEITVRSGGNLMSGRAVDIDRHGRLILEIDGKKTEIIAGEVTVERR